MPSAWARKLSTEFAVKFDAKYRWASAGLRFRFSRTSQPASFSSRPSMVTLLSGPCRAIWPSRMPTTAFTILASVIGSTPVGPTVTGWTDPIVVPIAIAARSVDSKRIVPALNAWAPVGPTHPRIGTVIALSIDRKSGVEGESGESGGGPTREQKRSSGEQWG